MRAWRGRAADRCRSRCAQLLATIASTCQKRHLILSEASPQEKRPHLKRVEISIYDYLISVSSLLNISISNGPHAALDMAVVEKGADSHGWGGGQDENLNRAVTFLCANLA